MMNDVTHLGFFDIAMMGNIPNIVYLVPTCKEEYFEMLEWGIRQKGHPVAISVLAMGMISSGAEDTTDYSILNKYQVSKKGKDVAVIALGDFYQLGEKVVEAHTKEKGVDGMRKILYLFFTITVISAFVGCSNTGVNNVDTSFGTSDVSKNNSIDENNKSQTDSEKEAKTVKKMVNMNITIGDTTFTATLEDNDTTKAFIKQLPLTVDMSELNGNEKYNYLSSNSRADKSSCPGMINEGDLMLYSDNCLVLFYKTFNTSYNYVKIGHIDNTIGLTKAIGSGSVKVTFSVGE